MKVEFAHNKFNYSSPVHLVLSILNYAKASPTEINQGFVVISKDKKVSIFKPQKDWKQQFIGFVERVFIKKQLGWFVNLIQATNMIASVQYLSRPDKVKIFLAKSLREVTEVLKESELTEAAQDRILEAFLEGKEKLATELRKYVSMADLNKENRKKLLEYVHSTLHSRNPWDIQELLGIVRYGKTMFNLLSEWINNIHSKIYPAVQETVMDWRKDKSENLGFWDWEERDHRTTYWTVDYAPKLKLIGMPKTFRSSRYDIAFDVWHGGSQFVVGIDRPFVLDKDGRVVVETHEETGNRYLKRQGFAEYYHISVINDEEEEELFSYFRCHYEGEMVAGAKTRTVSKGQVEALLRVVQYPASFRSNPQMMRAFLTITHYVKKNLRNFLIGMFAPSERSSWAHVYEDLKTVGIIGVPTVERQFIELYKDEVSMFINEYDVVIDKSMTSSEVLEICHRKYSELQDKNYKVAVVESFGDQEYFEDVINEYDQNYGSMDPLSVIIAGGRDFSDYERMKYVLDSKLTYRGRDIEIVSGGARGADSLGERYAEEKGWEVVKFPADWQKYGNYAGMRRNIEMANYSDVLIAFWNGKSKGTEHMIQTAKEHNLIVIVVEYDNTPPIPTPIEKNPTYLKQDMWSFLGEAELILIPTNGYMKKGGEAVMGAGVAKQAKSRYPDIPEILGASLRDYGNRVVQLTKRDGSMIGAFPTKHSWEDDSCLELIEESCIQLSSLIAEEGLTKVILPFPGIGNGKLSIEDVKPLLNKYLDDRVTVVYR